MAEGFDAAQSTAVREAARQEGRMVKMELGIEGILKHVENIDKHLVTLNHRTEKSETNIEHVDRTLALHLQEVEAYREVPRLELLEKDLATHVKEHNGTAQFADGVQSERDRREKRYAWVKALAIEAGKLALAAGIGAGMLLLKQQIHF